MKEQMKLYDALVQATTNALLGKRSLIVHPMYKITVEPNMPLSECTNSPELTWVHFEELENL